MTPPSAPRTTQAERPWQATIRTGVQLAVAIATVIPLVAGGVYADLDAAPVVVGQVLAVATTVTRVMAVPGVETFLRTWAPWLAADPLPRAQHRRE